MKILVRDLTESQLIWAVAKAEGYIDDSNSWLYQASVEEANDSDGWRPLTWGVAGPIIERERIQISPHNQQWNAIRVHTEQKMVVSAYGPTPLIAAMRRQLPLFN